MAMLAERKRKVKWALNPRGKLWSEDSTKFGQKILEKMGWSSGKGLGVNESGITEHIKVAFKNDSQGIGYKQRDDQWTQHEDEFNLLLSSLNGVSNIEIDKPASCTGLGFENKSETIAKEISGESLEDKSKKSKARVHYKKFTRGKDISKYSEKDLANIFGKKVDDITTQEQDLNTQVKDTERKDLSFGITTTESKLSINDYFNKKMPNKKASKYIVGSDGVLKSTKEEINDYEDVENFRPSFNMTNDIQANTPAMKETEDCIKSKIIDDISSKNKKKKKSKKTKLEETEDISNNLELDITLETSVLKITDKYKKKRKHVDDADQVLENKDSIDITNNINNDITLENTTNLCNDYNSDKKIKKKKSKETQIEKNECCILEDTNDNSKKEDNVESIDKFAKKNKKRKFMNDEDQTQDKDVLSEDMNNIKKSKDINIEKEIVLDSVDIESKKKKMKKSKNNDIQNEIVEESSNKKNKKKKNKKINIEEEIVPESIDREDKKKKKKKSKDINIEKEIVSEPTYSETIPELIDDVTRIKNKKSKRKEEYDDSPKNLEENSSNAAFESNINTNYNEIHANVNTGVVIENEIDEKVNKKKKRKVDDVNTDNINNESATVNKQNTESESNEIEGTASNKTNKCKTKQKFNKILFTQRQLEKKLLKEKLKKIQSRKGSFISKDAFAGSNFLKLPGYY